MLFDTHAHISDRRFDADLPEVLARMREAGVTLCLNVGDGARREQPALDLAQREPGVYAATGVHPHDASAYTEAHDALLRGWMARPRVVALGEIGLDYYYDHSPREVQRAVFARQLELARELGKPVILHIRDAHGDALDLLQARKGALPRGVMHCYSGSVECARQYLDLGFYISFAGPVTFPNARVLQEVARYVPPDRLLVETDCPYLAPQPARGKRNEPAYVRHTALHVARLRGVDMAEFCAHTRANGCALFGIQE